MDDQDNDIAVELLNNAEDDQLSLEDSERQSTTGAGGCFALALLLVNVMVIIFSFSKARTEKGGTLVMWSGQYSTIAFSSARLMSSTSCRR